MTDLDHARHDLAIARRRLDDFERSTTSTDFLERLAQECPMHATRLGMIGAPLASALLTMLAVGWLLLPTLGHDAGLFAARVDPFAMLPAVMIVNSLAALVLSLVFRHLAVERGRLSPLRAKERRTHAGLVGSVWRCEARLALAEADRAA